ncbi:MAG: hypothetical protein EXR45_02210 [Chloroflexi bacterium]|nr:hypothetical protein [Chloroflexota bacterium]
MNRTKMSGRLWRRSGLMALAISSVLNGASIASADTGVAPQALTGVLGYRGSSQHTGQYAVVGPQSLKLDWYVAGADDVNASVAIRADGTIYTVSTDGVLRASSSSGTELWTSQLGTRSYGAPVLTEDGDRIILGDQKGRVRAWNAGDGSGVWVSANYGQVLGAVSIGKNSLIWFIANNKRLVALKPDGTEATVVSLPADGVGTPAISLDGTVVIATIDGRVRRFSPTGDPTSWETALPASPTTSVVIGPDGNLYVGATTEMVAIAADSPAVLWRKSIGTPIRSEPAVGSDGSVYFGADDGKVYGISADGQTRWSDQTGAPVVSSPAIDAEGNVYIGSGDSIVYGYTSSGKRIATFRAFDAVNSPVVIGPNGNLFVGSRDNRMYALRDNTRNFASSPADRIGGDLIRDPATGMVYVIINGKRSHVPDPVTLARLGVGSRVPINATPEELAKVPVSTPIPALTDGSIISSSTGAVYRVSNGERVPMPEGAVNAIAAPDQVIRTVPLSVADGRIVKGTDERAYVIENGSRHWLTTAAALSRLGKSWSDVHLVTDSVLKGLFAGAQVD